MLLLPWFGRQSSYVQAFKYKKFVSIILNETFTNQCGDIFRIVQDLLINTIILTIDFFLYLFLCPPIGLIFSEDCLCGIPAVYHLAGEIGRSIEIFILIGLTTEDVTARDI